MSGQVEAGESIRPMRRSRLEISLDILRLIRGGMRKPTNIQYGANLSWRSMHVILRSLVSRGLITEIDARGNRDKRTVRRYEITRKGEDIVEYFDRGEALLNLREVLRTSL